MIVMGVCSLIGGLLTLLLPETLGTILCENIECDCGDINQDGTVNVLDVVSLVNLILSP